MEYTSRLPANIRYLLEKMDALKQIRDEAVRKNKQGLLDDWIKRVEILEAEVANIHDNLLHNLDRLSLGKMNAVNRLVMSSVEEIRSLKSKIDEIHYAAERRIREITRLHSFTHSNLKSFTSDFRNQVGKGGFGSVYRGQFPDGVQIAVKVLENNDVIEETFMVELEAIYKAYHQNLIQLFGYCYEKNMKALVYEYMENGSLDMVLYENRHNLKWEKLYTVATETAKGLAFLHDGCITQIIHHDVKPANVLLDSGFSPKITDFGVANIMGRGVKEFTMTGIKGTPGYVAPEIWMPFGRVTSKSDVYSFGMLLFEVLGRRRLYDDKSDEWFPEQVWKKFEDGQLDEIIEECGITGEGDIQKARVLSTVALWCAQHTPEVRPSMSTVFHMLVNKLQVTAPPNPFLTTDLGCSMRAAHSQVVGSNVSPIVTESLREEKDLKNAEDLVPRNFASCTNWNPSRSKDSVILFTESKYFIDKFHAQSLNCEDETWEVMIQSEQPPLLIVKGKYIGQPITEVTNIENDEKLSPATDQRLNEKKSQGGEASISHLQSIQKNGEESKECSTSKDLEKPE